MEATDANHEQSSSVLLVEDDPRTREGLATLLESAGYHVATASDGEEALSLLRQRPSPGVILLDLVMPRRDGFGFREEQLRDPALCDIPVIVLSGRQDARAMAVEMGVAGCVPKPVHFDKLLCALATALRQARGTG